MPNIEKALNELSFKPEISLKEGLKDFLIGQKIIIRMKNNSRIKSSIKIGLIGVGAWGKNYIKTIKEFSNIELVAILRNSRKYCKEAPKIAKYLLVLMILLPIKNGWDNCFFSS